MDKQLAMRLNEAIDGFTAAVTTTIEAAADGVNLIELPALVAKWDHAKAVGDRLIAQATEEASRASWTAPTDEPWVR